MIAWLWISTWLLSVNALNPVLCVNCKFFKKGFNTESRFGKCTMFPEQSNDSMLVDGISVLKKQDYKYCITARDFDSMCGKEGKFYQDKREM